MKILHWSDFYYPGSSLGGAPVFVRDLAREQQNNGHEVAVVTESYKGGNDYDNYGGIEVYRFPFTTTGVAGNLKEIHKLSIAAAAIKKKLQPDVIHVHLNQLSAWYDILSKNESGIPSLITIHPPVAMTSLPEGMLRRILMENDFIVAVSHAQKKDIDRFIGTDIKTRVIHNGVPSVKTPVLPLSFQPAVILCIGRLHQTKGFDVALKACAKVLDSLPDSIKIVVAGDGPEKNNLMNLRGELGIKPEQVEFRGWIDPDNVADLLNEGSIVLMPSVWNEPFGLVAAQAAQMGRPVIASNIGGIPEIVIDKETGLLVHPGNAEELADAMLFLLRNTNFATSLGENARKIAEDKFSMRRCAGEYDEIYETISSK